MAADPPTPILIILSFLQGDVAGLEFGLQPVFDS